MPNFDFITTRLATGGAITTDKDVEALVAAGVNAIIDCRDDEDDKPLLVSWPGVMYLWNGVPDDGVHPKPVSWFEKSLDFALPLLARPGYKVYCHCQAGRNRGPSTTLAIMMAQGWEQMAAEGIIKLRRPICAGGGIAYADDAAAAVKALGYA